MTDTFRALCAELTATLAERIDDKGDAGSYYVHAAHLLTRARAALADEPAVSKGREWPSDEELLDLHDWMADEWAANHDAELPLSQYARAVLARWGNPTPQPPADGEVAELVTELQSMATDADKRCRFSNAERLSRAAELLERQVLVPVSVSERLPEPSECAPWPKDSDASDWCWMGQKVDGGWEWEQRSAGYLVTFPGDFTHWIPAHALPLPEVDK